MYIYIFLNEKLFSFESVDAQTNGAKTLVLVLIFCFKLYVGVTSLNDLSDNNIADVQLCHW